MNNKQFFFTLFLAVTSGCLGGVLSVWFLIPQAVLAQDETQNVLEAREFRLVDASGKLRARLAIDDLIGSRTTGLEMFGENGEKNVILRTGDYGMAFLTLANEGGATAELTVNRQDSQLQLSRSTRNPRVRLGLSQKGLPSLTLFDQNNNLRSILGSTELIVDGTGFTGLPAPSSLLLFDEEGKVVWSAP